MLNALYFNSYKGYHSPKKLSAFTSVPSAILKVSHFLKIIKLVGEGLWMETWIGIWTRGTNHCTILLLKEVLAIFYLNNLVRNFYIMLSEMKSTFHNVFLHLHILPMGNFRNISIEM